MGRVSAEIAKVVRRALLQDARQRPGRGDPLPAENGRGKPRWIGREKVPALFIGGAMKTPGVPGL